MLVVASAFAKAHTLNPKICFRPNVLIQLYGLELI